MRHEAFGNIDPRTLSDAEIAERLVDHSFTTKGIMSDPSIQIRATSAITDALKIDLGEHTSPRALTMLRVEIAGIAAKAVASVLKSEQDSKR